MGPLRVGEFQLAGDDGMLRVWVFVTLCLEDARARLPRLSLGQV